MPEAARCAPLGVLGRAGEGEVWGQRGVRVCSSQRGCPGSTGALYAPLGTTPTAGTPG